MTAVDVHDEFIDADHPLAELILQTLADHVIDEFGKEQARAGRSAAALRG